MKNYCFLLIPAVVFFAIAGICFHNLSPMTFIIGAVSLLVAVSFLIAFNERRKK